MSENVLKGLVVGGWIAVFLLAIGLTDQFRDRRAAEAQIALLEEQADSAAQRMRRLHQQNLTLADSARRAQEAFDAALVELTTVRRESSRLSASLAATSARLRDAIRPGLDPSVVPQFDSLVVAHEDEMEVCENLVLAERAALESCQSANRALEAVKEGLEAERDEAVSLAGLREEQSKAWEGEAKRRGSFFRDVTTTMKITGLMVLSFLAGLFGGG